MGVDHAFIMAYICIYFACMEYTFIEVENGGNLDVTISK